jgi:hypothetical protein
MGEDLGFGAEKRLFFGRFFLGGPTYYRSALRIGFF